MERKFRLYRAPFYIGLFMLIMLVIVRALLPFWVRDYVNRKLSEMPEYRGHVAAARLHLWRGGYQIHNRCNREDNWTRAGALFRRATRRPFHAMEGTF